MERDHFDRLHGIALAVVAAALVWLLAAGARSGGASSAAGLDKALERQMAQQARVTLLEKLYGPVEELRRSGQLPAALLKLDELSRRYPGEAHGHILRGEILSEMGALEEAVASFVAGARLSGDYVDAESPLSRREEIRRLTEEGLKVVGDRARANPGNASLAAALKNVYYLQSRLAGGCE
jgi:hypothetical protein